MPRRSLQYTPTPGLTDDERAVENDLAARLGDASAESLYDRRPGTMSGRLLDADEARELSPRFQQPQDRSQFSRATYAPAAAFVQRRFESAVARPPGREAFVVFQAGGGGSGKKTASRNAVPGLLDQADVIYDTTLSDYDKAWRNIELALASGRNVIVQYVHTPFAIALRRAIDRATAEGRTVPLTALARAHVLAQESLLRLDATYGTHEQVAIQVLDNGDISPSSPTLEDCGTCGMLPMTVWMPRYSG